jgi:tRNA nucleotidyltransferase/poly(A) polymerase
LARRKKRSKNNYFTRVHQEAIVEYATTKDRGVRTTLYINLIEPAFDEMVNKIVYTYKFTNLPNIDYLKDECKIWLTTILDKFDPEKGSKAFSYFSVITKNWFIHKVKKNTRSLKREIHYDDVSSHDIQEYMTVENSYLEKRQSAEFWILFWQEVNQWEKTLKLKENEKKVLEAIKMLFSQAEDIEIFNKKAIYLYMREITGLNTKQIVNNLNKMRKKYSLFKQKWDEGSM